MSRCQFRPFRIAFPRLIVIMAMGLLLGACSSLRYYAQAAHGQGRLIVHQRRISKLVRDPATDPQLAARLQLAHQARRFASQRLGLPDNRSYTGYVALDRPYVVWNVFATPRFSVHAVPQCFPISGCVAYRGWFKEADARADAARLHARGGDDVWVGGVSAYSTLGWFADPILSSMLRWDDDELDSTIFHELAHQLIYVKGDTAFNESFATFVQTEGLREWRQSRGLPPHERTRAMDDGFTRLVLDLRARLKTLYASSLDEAAMAAGKQREIVAFRRRYVQWRERDWPGNHRYDRWVAQPINNARLLPFGLYDQWTSAFAVLFRRTGSHWPAFYASVRALARMPKPQREQALQVLRSAGS